MLNDAKWRVIALFVICTRLEEATEAGAMVQLRLLLIVLY